MGSVAALMLVVGGSDALSGIQNITIIMAAPFVLVMIAMCVALYKDLRIDPLVLRGQRGEVAVEQAVEFGTEKYGEGFHLWVRPDPVGQRRAEATKNGHLPQTDAPAVLPPDEDPTSAPTGEQDSATGHR
jgi:hypothetical protein